MKHWLPSLVVVSAMLVVVALAVNVSEVRSTTFGTIAWQRAIMKAQKARDLGRLRDAEIYDKAALSEAAQLGTDHPFYSITLRQLSDTAFDMRDLEKAKTLSLSELELLRPLGPDYQDRVPVLLRLADVCIFQNKLKEAEKYIEEARILRDKSVFNPSLRAEIDARLAVICKIKGDESGFKRYIKSAEVRWIKTNKEPKAGSNLNEFGLMLIRLSKYTDQSVAPALIDAAEYCLKRGIEIIGDSIGNQGLQFIHGYSRLAEFYRTTGRPEEELKAIKRGTELAKTAANLDDPLRVAVVSTYVETLVDEGRLDEAIALSQKEIQFAKVAGQKDPSIYFHSLGRLASLYIKARKPAEALATLKEALALCRQPGLHAKALGLTRQIERLSAQIKPESIEPRN